MGKHVIGAAWKLTGPVGRLRVVKSGTRVVVFHEYGAISTGSVENNQQS
jgi:hypothetical protein